MRKTSFVEIARAAEELLKQGQYGDAALLIGQIRLGYEDEKEWVFARELLNQIPVEQRVVYAAVLYAKALRFLREYTALMEWSAHVETYHLRVRDKILAVDGQTCWHPTMIWGEEGSSLTLTVQTAKEAPRECS